MSSYLQDLNPPQLEAVQHVEGPILVLAGAGSGKTRVLTRRVAHLVLQHHVNPWNILAVTFTNKATDEMKERLKLLLGDRANTLWASTFHSTGLRILRKNAPLLHYKADFTVYDDKDSKNLLKEILKELKIDEKKFPVQSFSRAIDQAKNSVIEPEEFEKWYGSRSSPYEAALQAEVYDRYQKALMKGQAMDFGDLLMNAVLLLERHPEVLEYYRALFRFILVDEYQDTNHAQYRLVKLVSEPRCNLLVVGDDDQSIYAFRGATIENILRFEQDFPSCKVVKLEQNYRSTSNILEAAHAIIKKNYGRKAKKLWTATEGGESIYAFDGSDELDEARFIAGEIEKRNSCGTPLRDVAVFYRTNAQSRALEEVLMSCHIPYRIYGGQKFYERKEVKDVIAYLRLLINEADDQAFLRTINTPSRGIGAQTLQNITAAAQSGNVPLLTAARKVGEKSKPVAAYLKLVDDLKEAASSYFLAALIEKVINDTEYAARLQAMKDPAAQSRLENLKELEAIGRSMEEPGESHLDTLLRFLDRVSLTTSDESPEDSTADNIDQEMHQKKDAVTLMTLHLAKGLEFPIVFLTGLEEGLLPHYLCFREPDGIDEERRLCYVGITRAMQVLYLTKAYARGLFGGGGEGFGGYGGFREPSRFLYDLPEELIQHLHVE